MAELSEIIRSINILVNDVEFDDLKESLGIVTLKDYIELDEDTFLEYNLSIPYNIGADNYTALKILFENNQLDYVRVYNNSI